MDSRCRISCWMPALALGAAVLIAGCSEAVLLTHETGQGGVVTYLYKEMPCRVPRGERRAGAKLQQRVECGGG